MVRIKRGPLVFQNVLSTTFRHHPDEWATSLATMQRGIVQSELYTTGPLIFKIEEIDGQTSEALLKVLAPVNAIVDLEENNRYEFEEEFILPDTLILRHPDIEDSLHDTYAALVATANEFNLQYEETFYHIHMEVFGETMFDVVLPLKEGQTNDQTK